jgi:hypothetical protein
MNTFAELGLSDPYTGEPRLCEKQTGELPSLNFLVSISKSRLMRP